MDIGLIYELQTPRPWHERSEYDSYHQAIEQSILADRLGFHSVWAVEHHFLVEYSHCSAPEIFLTAVAASTERIRVGHGVVLLPTPFNHPARVAERTAALDIVSKGRLEVGTGRSITEAELGGFDIDPVDSRPMWEESVRLLPKMWTQEVFEGFDGKYVKMPPRPIVPKPVQKPHPPMWMACTQPDSFRVAAELGLGALAFGFGPLSRVEEWYRIYREAEASCTDPVGEFANHRFAPAALTYCGESDEESVESGTEPSAFFAASLAQLFAPWIGKEVQGYEYYTDLKRVQEISGVLEHLPSPVEMQREGYTLMGAPGTCLRTLRRYFEMGADLVLCLVQAGHLPHEKIMASLERLGAEVLPEVRSWSKQEVSA
jgi:alkanesulfonate monooxygenase SsuD/methylene tetrahydromethanopterin reductase-like flavin-dependent oxidoreductase (luciferase family)